MCVRCVWETVRDAGGTGSVDEEVGGCGADVRGLDFCVGIGAATSHCCVWNRGGWCAIGVGGCRRQKALPASSRPRFVALVWEDLAIRAASLAASSNVHQHEALHTQITQSLLIHLCFSPRQPSTSA